MNEFESSCWIKPEGLIKVFYNLADILIYHLLNKQNTIILYEIHKFLKIISKRIQISPYSKALTSIYNIIQGKLLIEPFMNRLNLVPFIIYILLVLFDNIIYTN